MIVRCMALHCVASAALLAPVSAQFAWVTVPSPTVYQMVYDSARDVIVAIGGSVTHEFDGVTWRSVASLSFPASYSSVGAFDKLRQRTVLLDPITRWTWEWDGLDWAQIAQLPYRPWILGSMAYDEARGRVVLIQQSSSGNLGVDLLEWDGLGWATIATANPPPTSNGPPYWNVGYGPMVYDAKLQKIVLFGMSTTNLNNVTTGSATSWELGQDNNWVWHTPSGPEPAGGGWFDLHRGQFLRYDNATLASDRVLAREADRTWTAVTVTGMPLNNGLMYSACFDARRRRLYLIDSVTGAVGYLTDTYPATYAHHGAACPIPAPPDLALSQSWTLPWIGGALSVQATPAPLSLAMLAMGFSDVSFQGTPLPMSLAQFGMPGCQLHVAADATLLGAGANGVASFQLPLPFDLNLVGTRFWQQALVLAPGANPAGLVVTNSCEGVVGRSR